MDWDRLASKWQVATRPDKAYHTCCRWYELTGWARFGSAGLTSYSSALKKKTNVLTTTLNCLFEDRRRVGRIAFRTLERDLGCRCQYWFKKIYIKFKIKKIENKDCIYLCCFFLLLLTFRCYYLFSAVVNRIYWFLQGNKQNFNRSAKTAKITIKNKLQK